MTRIEWSVIPLSTDPDDRGVRYVPQLDNRGREALAFLEAFVAGLSKTK